MWLACYDLLRCIRHCDFLTSTSRVSATITCGLLVWLAHVNYCYEPKKDAKSSYLDICMEYVPPLRHARCWNRKALDSIDQVLQTLPKAADCRPLHPEHSPPDQKWANLVFETHVREEYLILLSFRSKPEHRQGSSKSDWWDPWSLTGKTAWPPTPLEGNQNDIWGSGALSLMSLNEESFTTKASYLFSCPYHARGYIELNSWRMLFGCFWFVRFRLSSVLQASLVIWHCATQLISITLFSQKLLP